MTEKANPSINRPAEAFKTAGAIAYGGHGGDGFVVDGANPTDISTQDGGITEADLNAFDETSDSDSLDVTIDGGEAFVFGSWLAIDTDTTVSLDASTDGQTVYVGWNKNGADDVIVGLDADFSDASGDSDERIPLWTFDTDGSGVTSVTDERLIGKSINSVTGDINDANHNTEWIDTSESGVVTEGNFGLIFTTEIQDQETLYITRASYHEIGEDDPILAASADTELSIADSTEIKQTVLSGDGETVYSNETGEPLASYQNTTGSAEQIIIGVDNGQFGTGAGEDIDIQASFIGRQVE